MDLADFDSLFFNLAGRAPDEMQGFWRRVRHTLRRHFNEGVLGFLLGMLALVLAAISFRSWYSTRQKYIEEVNKEIGGATSRNEPRQDEERMGVLTSVLAPLNSREDDLWRSLVSEDNEDAKLGAAQVLGLVDGIQNAFREIYRAAEELRYKHERCCDADPKDSGADPKDGKDRKACGALSGDAERASELLDRGLPGRAPHWSALCAERLKDYALDTQPQLLAKRLTDPSATSARQFGPIATRQDAFDPDCITVVPALRRHLLWPTVTSDGMLPGLELEPREWRAVLAAGFIVPAIQRFAEQLEKVPGANQLRIVQVYWVSPDSVFAHWLPGLRTKDAAQFFPPLKLWAAAHYLQELLRDPESDPYDSPAYIDYGGGGIVLTRSRVIRRQFQADALHSRQVAAATGYSPSDDQEHIDDELLHSTNWGQVAGAIVVDVGIPTEWFLRKLVEHAKLIRVEHLKIRQANEGEPIKVEPKRPMRGGLFFPAELKWEKVSPHRIQEIEGKLNEMRADRSLYRRVTPLKLAGNQEFLVPIGASSAGTRDALLVRYETPSQPLSTRFAALLSCFFTALTLATMLYAWKTSMRSAGLRDKVWLMSNLQVGVLSMGIDDEVVEANDRAMEVLQVELPKAGVRQSLADVPEMRFPDLIEEFVVHKNGHPTRGDGKARWKVEKYGDLIPRLRSQGVASSYYARVKHCSNERWIRVWGTPILGREAKSTKRRTFGIVQVVDQKKLHQRLEDRFNAHKRKLKRDRPA